MPRFSLAGRFLLVVFAVTVVPLVGLSVWLVVGTRRAGEALLRERLETSLLQAAEEVGAKWLPLRAALLEIAEDSALQRQLASSAQGPIAPRSAGVEQLRPATHSLLIQDGSGKLRWALPDSIDPTVEALQVQVPIWRGGSSQRVGTLQAGFRTSALVPVSTALSGATGGVFGVIDRTTGYVAMPVPFDPELTLRPRFEWRGDQWLSARRALDEPYIELVAAAPVGPFTLPFQRAARRGLVALLAVAGVGFALTILLTRRLTRSLVMLAEGADAVAGGDLDRQVEVRTRDEVGRLARAFNTMTDSLRRTLAELSQRQAVAAVGEFAAALAHEIRNPLSAIRLNLQHVEEKLPAEHTLRDPVAQSLRDIQRLEKTVAGALRVARTGRMRFDPLELQDVLAAAVRSARPELQRRILSFEWQPSSADRLTVNGNAAALEQVFLNLLINAAQATDSGGVVGISSTTEDDAVIVTVWDTGCGFPDDARGRVFEPFFTTKPEGSGLGLTVARRIVSAHGGTIELESQPGRGTRVHVRLPRNGAVHAT